MINNVDNLSKSLVMH